MLHKRIRTLRKERGITQQALAELTGSALSSIHTWEAGKVVPDVASVRALAKALGVRPGVLIDDEPEGNESAPDGNDEEISTVFGG